MIRLYTLAFIFLMINLNAQKILLKDNFEYSAGALINANSWNTHSGTTSPIAVVSPGLSWSKTTYIGSGKGNAAALAANGMDDNKPFTNWVDTNSVYASFLFKVAGTISATNAGYFAHFIQYVSTTAPVYTAVSTNFRGRIFTVAATDSTKFKIGFTFNSNIATDGGVTEDLNVGETYLAVMKYTVKSGVENDEVSLFLFKDGDNITTEPAKPTIGPIAKTGTSAVPDLTIVQGFALRQFAANENVIIDGLFVRDGWNLKTESITASDDIFAGSIKVYPNPVSSGTVFISHPSNEEMKVSLFDLTGRKVLDQTTIDNQIDVSTLNKGVYLLKLTQFNDTAVKKLIVH